MRLSDWVKTRKRGEISRLVRVAEVAGTTIHDALNGKPVARYDTAKRISDATGGVVTIAELCDPSADGKARRRRPNRKAA